MRASKSQSEAVCRGEDARGCPWKEDCWAAAEKHSSETKKNRHLETDVVAAPVRPLSLLARKGLE